MRWIRENWREILADLAGLASLVAATYLVALLGYAVFGG